MKSLLLTSAILMIAYLNSFSQVVKSSADSLPHSDSAATNLHDKIKLTSFIIPSVFVGYGVVSLIGDNSIIRLDHSTSAELQEDHPTFLVKADNYFRYAPILAIYGLDLIGVKAKNEVLDRTIMLLGSYVLVSLTTNTIKGLSNRLRPDGSNYHSFPSGHTSMAFMTAELLHQEYKDESIWYSVGGYTIASVTGILRLYNNQHWVSDIVAGAGLGILSTKLIYLAYPSIKQKLSIGKSPSLCFTPGYQHHLISFNLTKRL